MCVYTYVMEIIGECPTENAEEASKRLGEVMIESSLDVCSVRMKVDCSVTERWYSDDFSNLVHGMYEDAIADGKEPMSVRNSIYHKYDFISTSVLDDMIDGNFDFETRTDI